MRKPIIYVLLTFLVLQSLRSYALVGTLSSHDPSSIIKDGNTYWVYSTGFGITTSYSTDLINWMPGERVYNGFPFWITRYVSDFDGTFWAPHIEYMNNKFYLYYSCSTRGALNCAIGVATSPTLDQNSPDYKWTDLGMVVSSNSVNTTNALDPYVFQDSDNEVYLLYGTSNAGGVSISKIDKRTGKLKGGTVPQFICSSAEAPALVKENNFYYLIANRGVCCKGILSTSYMIGGRSTDPMGPFIDQSSKALTVGGGTTLLSSTGKYIGPSHFGLLKENDISYVSMHYYDGTDNGVGKLDVAKLDFKNDWPVITRDWIPNGAYYILNFGNGLAWQIKDCKTTVGSSIIQNPIQYIDCQKWNFKTVGEGYYSIASGLSNTLVADVANCNKNNGAPLQIWNSVNSTCQKFKIERTINGSYVITPSHADRVVEVPSHSSVAGIQLALYTYNGCDCQKWIITPFVNGLGFAETEETNKLYGNCFPSPFTSEFNIKSDGQFHYTIIHLSGKVEQEGEGVDNVKTGNSLPKGIYLVKITKNQDTQWIKVAKE